MCEFDWDDMEFYDVENPESDRVISELVESVKKGVRKTFLDEMARLRKENEELRDVKERWEDVKAELEKAIRDAKIAQEGADARAKKMKAAELLEQFSFEAYAVDCRLEYLHPKCDKCDALRNVEFASPSGRKMKEPCTCSVKVKRYVVEEEHLFKFYARDKRLGTMYFDRNNAEDRYDAIDSERFSDDKPFETLKDVYRPLFTSGKRAEAYCDWCNSKEVTLDE